MDTDRTVRVFTDFYRERGHHLITGGTLLPPPGDPVLFTTSGMHPLTPYLEGRPHPRGHRLVYVQRCLRTTDLDEVGDSTHLTVFEMLGSWSLGDYGHPQSLRWGYELLREGFGIPHDRLHVTVFGGDGQVGPDLESLRTWEELGVPVELTREDNWWSNGPVGPCGPDSEIFVWTGSTPPHGTPTTDPRWVEIWNHVVMRYRRLEDGSLQPLRRPGIDTGMGLERLLTVLQGRDSVYDTDLFEPWTRLLSPLWDLDGPSLRLVCDHLRSAVVVLGDGVRPSHTGRGYVLRRVVRRLLATVRRDDPSRTLDDLPVELLQHTLDHFRTGRGTGLVRDELLEEERRFDRLLERGRRLLSGPRYRGPLGEEDYEYLHDTHGLPRDLVLSLRREG
ncbi:alanine--tRNA ligase-related protein [Streptomyces pseudovenezuelae]|uniref:alanine--tRNA ligase-related protein n=1 Tax=Streptomyces pseudovenezuelae TaxID=67350 RepID=UPI002E824187|nr:alanine--tRNA ligase-related protein [Streptomyces pseudovenezuelae]WUA93242.1 alanine--tRNA ligase-related protein [Streptomyces pseudovenezuelae]